jgi:hypothetical protein
VTRHVNLPATKHVHTHESHTGWACRLGHVFLPNLTQMFWDFGAFSSGVVCLRDDAGLTMASSGLLWTHCPPSLSSICHVGGTRGYTRLSALCEVTAHGKHLFHPIPPPADKDTQAGNRYVHPVRFANMEPPAGRDEVQTTLPRGPYVRLHLSSSLALFLFWMTWVGAGDTK